MGSSFHQSDIIPSKEACMRRVIVSAAALLVIVGSSTAAAQKPTPSRGPVTVFIGVRAAEPPASPEELTLRRDKAKAAGAALDELRAAHLQKFGKNLDSWPPEATQALDQAFYKLRVASQRIWFAKVSDQDLADSTKDLQADVANRAKKGWMKVVETRDDADVIVEVVGRSTEVRIAGDLLFSKASILGGNRITTYEVLPGRIGMSILTQIPFQWPYRSTDRRSTEVTADHWFTNAEPFFRFTVGDNQRWSFVSYKGAMVLDGFARDNYAILKPAR
jgi:hypothetical protein